MTRKAVVVGAGLGGLSAACHLVGRGWDVEILERADVPGGRAGRVERDGFSFDTGPTVLTMPDLLAQVFAAAGAEMSDFLTLRRLDPAYRACFADGSELLVRADRGDMVEEIRSLCGARSALEYERYCDWLERLYRLEVPSFLDRNYDHPAGLLRPARPALSLAAMGALGRLEHRVERAFSDDRLRRLFSFQALYAGVAPQQAVAVLAVIAYMDVVAGVWFPDGGMHAVAVALAEAAIKAGATLRCDTPVERILLAGGDHGPVVGVATASGVVHADVVVCNADLPGAYALVPGMALPRRLRAPRLSPSALVWHAGVRATPGPWVAHHNIHFGAAWDRSFDELIERGQRMTEPSTLVSVPTVSDPTLAPAGSSILYGLEPVPNLRADIDWAGQRRTNEDDMLARLGALGYPVDDIAVSWLVDPDDWAAAGLVGGTPFSIAHRFRQSGPFRAANIERRAPGLVFAGCGTVPGVGVPMVLMSGRLAAERADAMAAA